jgi:putative membrane protein
VRISYLPHLNAILNTTSACLLLLGIYLVKKRRLVAHQIAMLGAAAISSLFLISYLTYHYFHGSTRFTGTGIIRPVYMGILLSHTVLAALVAPLVILTLIKGLRGEIISHVKIARWTFPIWFYVSVTGVLIYLLLYHLYPA